MTRGLTVVLAVAAVVWTLPTIEPATAQTTGLRQSVPPDARDVSAQRRRAPARIVVQPVRRAAYPGRNAVRDCVAWLQPEMRPSGPVITPQMRCWWVPG